MINIDNVNISSNISGTINVSGDINHDPSKVILELIVLNKNSDIYIKFKRESGENYSSDILYDGWYTYYAIAVDATTLDDELNLTVSINDTFKKLSSANEIIDYLDMMNIQSNSIDNACRDLFFINNLRQCVLQLEKAMFDDVVCSCIKSKCLDQTPDRNIADFLLITMFLLENLIHEGRFEESQHILDSLNMCENICKVRTNKKCNCDDLRF